MTREKIIEQLNLIIGLIKQDGKDWLDNRDIPMLEECVKALSQEPILDKLDMIITDALDISIDQKESQTLRWVLDMISEVR